MDRDIEQGSEWSMLVNCKSYNFAPLMSVLELNHSRVKYLTRTVGNILFSYSFIYKGLE